MKRVRICIAVVVAVVAIASPSSAAPIVYDQFISGTVTIIASQGGVEFMQQTMSLDSVSATIDLATSSLLALDVYAAGPITLDFAQPMNGLTSVSFQDAAGSIMQPATLTQYPVPVELFAYSVVPIHVTAPVLTGTLIGGGVVNGSIDHIAQTSGTVALCTATIMWCPSGFNEIDAVVESVMLGMFADPFGMGNPPVQVIADFRFSAAEAAIPEPQSAALFGIGAMLCATYIRRQRP